MFHEPLDLEKKMLVLPMSSSSFLPLPCSIPYLPSDYGWSLCSHGAQVILGILLAYQLYCYLRLRLRGLRMDRFPACLCRSTANTVLSYFSLITDRLGALQIVEWLG